MTTKQYKTGYVTDPQRVEVVFSSSNLAFERTLHESKGAALIALSFEVEDRFKRELAELEEQREMAHAKIASMIQQERESPTP